MSTEDEILETELAQDDRETLHELLENVDFVTTVLLEIEEWLDEQDDQRGRRIVEKATLQMAAYEADEN